MLHYQSHSSWHVVVSCIVHAALVLSCLWYGISGMCYWRVETKIILDICGIRGEKIKCSVSFHLIIILTWTFSFLHLTFSFLYFSIYLPSSPFFLHATPLHPTPSSPLSCLSGCTHKSWDSLHPLFPSHFVASSLPLFFFHSPLCHPPFPSPLFSRVRLSCPLMSWRLRCPLCPSFPLPLIPFFLPLFSVSLLSAF